MVKFHQDAALDILFKNFTTNIQNYLAWRAKWLKNRKLNYPVNKNTKKELGPFLKKAIRRFVDTFLIYLSLKTEDIFGKHILQNERRSGL